jgi:hypothetical protein
MVPLSTPHYVAHHQESRTLSHSARAASGEHSCSLIDPFVTQFGDGPQRVLQRSGNVQVTPGAFYVSRCEFTRHERVGCGDLRSESPQCAP